MTCGSGKNSPKQVIFPVAPRKNLCDEVPKSCKTRMSFAAKTANLVRSFSINLTTLVFPVICI